MRAVKCPRRARWVGAVVFCAVCGYGLGRSFAELPDFDPLVLSLPPDRTVLLSDTLDLLGGRDPTSLTVDGKSYSADPFAPPVRVFRLKLTPGIHELQLGNQRRQVFIATDERPRPPPKDWSIHRAHPSVDAEKERCAACHETSLQAQGLVVGDVKDYRACFECHTSVDFEVIHAHPLDPISACQICHAMHGANHKALLKAPIKQLCDECHES